MLLYTLSTGDRVFRYQKSIVIPFEGQRTVLSTSPINGGYSEKLKAVFNQDANPGAGMACTLRADTYLEHMALITKEIGLDPEFTAGLTTAASMENVSIQSVSYKELAVTAIVTGGIEVNGGRVCDPTEWHEIDGKPTAIKEGTINIILVIDGNLPGGTMARALVTCTEAKTAALQELMAGSNYSRGLATGSGTDGTIIIANAESPYRYENAGKHNKLGELIGLAVKAAVKEALYLQSGLCDQSQFSVLNRLKRFGINLDRIWLAFPSKNEISKAEFVCKLEMLDKDPELVVLSSFYAHLIDQLDWDLLTLDQVANEANNILGRMSDYQEVAIPITISGETKDALIESMTDNLVNRLSVFL